MCWGIKPSPLAVDLRTDAVVHALQDTEVCLLVRHPGLRENFVRPHTWPG